MFKSGILAIQQLRQLVEQGVIKSETPLDPDQLQPNSLDVRLGGVAYRARYSFLAVNKPVEQMLADLTLDKLDLTDEDGAILETGKVYVIPLQESLELTPNLLATANPKSSSGRLDMLVRLLTDRGDLFDSVPENYSGPLYLEVVPRAFPIRVRRGDRLSQLRLASESPCALTDEELAKEIAEHNLIVTDDGLPISNEHLALSDGVFLTVHVRDKADATIGYAAKRCTPAVDLRLRDHTRRHFWHYIATPRRSGGLILQPNEFYIFSSSQRVVIPPHLCAEMVPYDAKSGELRTHYAGFFDSGFGYVAEQNADNSDRTRSGARVVLEVRNLDVPFLLQDGQRLFRLRYFRNSEVPQTLYGQSIKSNYQGQGLQLSKHFGIRDSAEDSPQLELW